MKRLEMHEALRLMKAAPELLDALRAMLAHQREGTHNEDMCSACWLARDAIARAEGGLYAVHGEPKGQCNE